MGGPALDARGPEVSLRHPGFRDAVADLSAPLHGVAKEALVGEDLRQQRRWTRLRNSMVTVLVLLGLLAGAASVLFFRQRNVARAQTAIAEGREFAARANDDDSPYSALVLAVEAELRTPQPLPEARDALARAVQRFVEIPGHLARPPLDGKTGDVDSVAWSPDGTRLATAGGVSDMGIWDAASGHHLRTLKGHTQPVASVAWSPDGTRLASASQDETVRIWDATSGRLNGPYLTVLSLAWSPDGTRLAAGSQYGTVRIWAVATGRSLGALEGHSDWVVAVAWSPDGTRLASGSKDGTARLWILHSSRPLEALMGHTKDVWSVAWSPDGTRLASASADHTVRLWAGITERRVCQLATQMLGSGALQQLLGADRGTPKCANPDAIQDFPALPLLPS